MKEVAALAGYNITSTTDAQQIINKARALRRVNIIKAHVTGMFGGHWNRNYREGYLGLVAIYSTGTVTATNGSQVLTGSGTAWTSSMAGQSVRIGVEYYRIASVSSATQLYLSIPFQGTTASSLSYQIWQDRYRVYPDVFCVYDFINFVDPAQMSETWSGNLRRDYPAPTQNRVPRLWSAIGNVKLTTSYSTGTVSGSANSNVLTGSGTSWLANLEPGWDITISSTIYRVMSVDSDTQVTLYQMLPSALAAVSYSAVGRNVLQIRFSSPSSQQLVNYGYFSKDWPFVNDSDSDWISELYPELIIAGVTWLDFLDKSDTVRAREAHLSFENAIKDVHVAEHMNYTGPRTIGYNIPSDARDQ